jgi:hypothetical protein
MMARKADSYWFRCVGTTGCEILDPTGAVLAWTVDEAWAAIIVRLLNGRGHPGDAVGAGVVCGDNQPPYNIRAERK